MPASEVGVGAFLRAKKTRGEAAFMPFLTAGYPSLGSMRDILLMLRDAGADCLELGVPFSDPVADGVTIQQASQAALEGGATFEACLRIAESASRMGHRIAMMSYANPMLQGGLPAAARKMADAGATAVIVPDLPLEESGPWRNALSRAGLDLAMFASPTTTPARLGRIDRLSRGFIYYVSLTGVTGERSSLPAGLAKRLSLVARKARLPVCVGFGISSAAQAGRLATLATGVIVGSALVRRLAGWERGGAGKRREISRWSATMARSVRSAVKSR